MFKKILLILLLTSLLSSCWNNEENKEISKKYSTYVVKTGNLSSIEKFTGYTSWKTEVMLATKVPGRITYLSKNVWDKVRKWELIASLDWTEAKTWYSSATNIINSLYSLRKQTGLSFDGQIASIKAKIEQAKIWIKWVTTWLEDTKKITQRQLETAKSWVEQAKVGLETAEKNLEETKKTLETNRKNILDWWISAITQAIILYKNVIDFSDKTLWITPENKRYNDRFEDYLWAKDSIQLKKTENLFKKTKPIFDRFEKYYNEKIDKKQPTEEEIIEWLKLGEQAGKAEKDLLKELYTTVDNSIENINFPIEIINEYKKNISTFGSQVESSLLTTNWNFILWMEWSLQNIKTLDSNEDKALSLLKKQVELAKTWLETAKKTYEQYVAMSEWKINWVSTKKDIAESQLKEAMEWLKAVQAQKEAALKEIDTKIAQAWWQRANAWVMINNWKVYSNISWIVTQKMAEVWQVINAWMPIYKVINIKQLKVKTSVPENIYKNLKIGQNINLKVEWYNKNIIWKISLISKAANKFTKKYDIEITIYNKNLDIPVWAMSTIFIKQTDNSKKITNAIIPNNAIISNFSLPAVYVLKDWKAVLKTIKIIKMWDEKSEVTGIKSLDKIITNWKENIFDWEVLEKIEK